MLGAWEFKPGLTKKTIRERREVEKEIFENLNFPRELYREWSLRSNKPSFAIRITVALYDDKSEKACCNEATGLCGNSNADCLCPYYKDFSAYFAL